MSEVRVASTMATGEVEIHGAVIYVQKALLDHIQCLLICNQSVPAM